MNYVAPFQTVRDYLTVSQSPHREAVTGSYENFLGAIRLLLAGIAVDEDWYTPTLRKSGKPPLPTALEAILLHP